MNLAKGSDAKLHRKTPSFSRLRITSRSFISIPYTALLDKPENTLRLLRGAALFHVFFAYAIAIDETILYTAHNYLLRERKK